MKTLGPKQKQLALIAVVLFVVVMVGINLKGGKEAGDNIISPTPTPVASIKPVSGTNTSTKKTGVAGKSTYDQLLVEYAGRRIQFDVTCQAIPGSITYKNGTSVMFDNRSGDARIITIDGVQYSFPGYGYKIVTLSSQTLPHVVGLSCGAAVNVGVINIQN